MKTTLRLNVAVVLMAVAAGSRCFSADPPLFGLTGDRGLLPQVQVQERLPVRVVDSSGQPVAGVAVTPWALRCSQGHGWWDGDKDPSEMQPETVVTNEAGEAAVIYPRLRNVEEGTRTMSVSLRAVHRNFACPDSLHIDVPHEQPGPYEIKLEDGASVILRPTLAGLTTGPENVFMFWSDDSSWHTDEAIQALTQTLRLPPLKPGSHSVLAAKLEGERVTHFSGIVDFQVPTTDEVTVDLALQPAARIEGQLSSNVPRPVANGRIAYFTLAPQGSDYRRVIWFSWVPVRPDGSFTIEAWPAGETLQLIALCDGFIAKSGAAPATVVNPPDPATDPFQRPQVFDPSEQEPITVEMEPLVPCTVRVVDEDHQPVAGIQILSSPNVGWWNNGSQIYCYPLVRGERRFRERDYLAPLDEVFPAPFRGVSDGTGTVTLQLPQGSEQLAAISDLYELPIMLGRRSVTVDLVAGETPQVTLQLQPKGTERLGEWDKLAGVVFGCSTREGRRICALPEVNQKMRAFTIRFRDAKNQRDPQLLAEAYTLVADAFANVGDLAESVKWRQKAAEQTAQAREPQD